MLYILLIIIAVGVLLASEAGKGLLTWLLIICGIGFLCWLGFWVILFLIALIVGLWTAVSTNAETIGTIFDVIFLCALGLFVLYIIVRAFRDFFSSSKKSLAHSKAILVKNWKADKSSVILLALLFSCAIMMIIWAIISVG